MTTVMEPTRNTWDRCMKTNPNCPGDRHRPEHRSFVKGCTCPETLAAEQEYQAAKAEAKKVTRATCRGPRHTASQSAYNEGCRCPKTVAAHERWKASIGRSRSAVIAEFHRTGVCVAPFHNSRRSYEVFGCRCATSAYLHNRHQNGRKPRSRPLSGKALRYPVSRNNLLLLLAGVWDRPTVGEQIAALTRLERRRVPAGPYTARPLKIEELAGRLRCSERVVNRIRAERARLRDQRHLRRLADVQAKMVARGKPSR